MMLGDETSHCFGCTYCRANDGKKLSFQMLPSELNPYFRDIPVAVNCFYGDPMLQVENTKLLLKRLETDGHRGPVILITKGDVSLLEGEKYNLDLHIGLSTCGKGAEKYDGGKWERFVANLTYCKEHGYNYHIEFRPIIKNLNDSDESFATVIGQAKEHGVKIGYCGLQVSDELRKRLKDEGVEFEPYTEKGFSLKKVISKEVNDRFVAMATESGVDVYKKTSCIISTLKGERDYNAHYYRPNEVGCVKCPNNAICRTYFATHNKEGSNVERLKDIIPFDFEIVEAKGHICSLYRNGLCGFPSDDCLNITGRLIKINEKVTTSDVRLIKWLTGMTVDAEFEEIPYISEKWIKKEE